MQTTQASGTMCRHMDQERGRASATSSLTRHRLTRFATHTRANLHCQVSPQGQQCTHAAPHGPVGVALAGTPLFSCRTSPKTSGLFHGLRISSNGPCQPPNGLRPRIGISGIAGLPPKISDKHLNTRVEPGLTDVQRMTADRSSRCLVVSDRKSNNHQLTVWL